MDRQEEEIIAGLHRLERTLLPVLIKHSSLKEMISASGMQGEVEVLRALRWLEAKGLCGIKEESEDILELGQNGQLYRQKGLPETRFLKALGTGAKMTLSQLMKVTGLNEEEVNVSIGLLKKRGLINVQRAGAELAFTAQSTQTTEHFAEQQLLEKLPHPLATLSTQEQQLARALLARRDIIKMSTSKSVEATLTEKGKRVALNPALQEQVIDRLTPEMLKSGKWENLRTYDIQAGVSHIFFGKKQPYRRFLEEVRSKLVAMGFKEMSGPIVESEFWDMDALFMPQFHSARDIHDAYYIKEPKHATDLPTELVEKVKTVHEKGMPGSKGWRYQFDYDKTSRLILRSHDTSITPRTLSSKELEVPGKYFQIARCFRYDVIDATHNADFDQIGGFVVDRGLTLRHLFGLLRLFAKEFCGTDDIKVVPAYFPFTEPSAGLYAKHPVMGWIELAGAGIFRPEMTTPLGVREPVIAWGIGLGRVAMFKLGLEDIRQLYSHDLNYLRSAKVIS